MITNSSANQSDGTRRRAVHASNSGQEVALSQTGFTMGVMHGTQNQTLLHGVVFIE
ncbi:hypothetical protein RB7736 [Rhodopirellula baltica SH 1]|uniref:Uncharacterized protein n=1 Tax=Rhodopirellula baltica (strain DSM 10527 / NCIMB 13988 / SH1) TaxID=243090 RepID=Q7UN78_RHOBA|nr:hypothetical protein RB7736 [Rhodopirellula baltica SH 1]